MSKVVEVLKAARELISDPAHWTKGRFARTEKGSPINYESPAAVCFCSAGALMRVTWGDIKNYRSALDILVDVMDGDIFGFNDLHPHSEVLSRFDLAIERALA